MKKILKPEWFERRREISNNFQIVYDTAKTDQILTKRIFSYDLLVSSVPKIWTEYLPYLEEMDMFSSVEFMEPFKNMWPRSGKQNYGYNSYVNKVEEGDVTDHVKDQIFNEQLDQKNRYIAQKKKKELAGDGLAVFDTMKMKEDRNIVKVDEDPIEDSSNEEIELDDDELEQAVAELTDSDIDQEELERIINNE